MRIIFDVKHLYYLPQYLPVYQELTQRGINASFVFYHQADQKMQQVCHNVIKNEQLEVEWLESESAATVYYQEQKADWIIFGNTFNPIEEIHKVSKTALMQHGIGPKSCYYHCV